MLWFASQVLPWRDFVLTTSGIVELGDARDGGESTLNDGQIRQRRRLCRTPLLKAFESRAREGVGRVASAVARAPALGLARRLALAWKDRKQKKKKKKKKRPRPHGDNHAQRLINRQQPPYTGAS